MGATEDIAAVRRGYEAFNAADMNTLAELFDERACWHTPGRGSLAGDHKGPGGDVRVLRSPGTGHRRDLQG